MVAVLGKAARVTLNRYMGVIAVFLPKRDPVAAPHQKKADDRPPQKADGPGPALALASRKAVLHVPETFQGKGAHAVSRREHRASGPGDRSRIAEEVERGSTDYPPAPVSGLLYKDPADEFAEGRSL